MNKYILFTLSISYLYLYALFGYMVKMVNDISAESAESVALLISKIALLFFTLSFGFLGYSETFARVIIICSYDDESSHLS